MQTELSTALELLIEAAKGRAFMWRNSDFSDDGYRAVSKIEVRTVQSIVAGGRGYFSITALSEDFTNVNVGYGPTLDRTFADALDKLAALPLVTDITLFSPAPQTPANDAAPDAPAAEVA